MGFESSSADHESDAKLITLSLSRPETFGVIFDRHFAVVHTYLARRIGVSKADDLAATTFTVAFERRRRFRDDVSSARPWLFGIATNLLRNERRSELRALEALGRVRSMPVGGGSAAEGIDPRLAQLLRQMDADQRDVLLLFAWGELSYEEIAASLRIPVGTVRSRLARAREQLRQSLAADEGYAAGASEANG